MKTVVIQIGNSDDKLTQRQWALFVERLHKLVKEYTAQIHFFGYPSGGSLHQNCCCVAEISEQRLTTFTLDLEKLRAFFKQDSAAITIGDTQFI